MKKYSIAFLIIIFLIIIVRLFYLNVYKHAHYENELYQKTNLYVYGVSAKRGRILDVNGNVLVDNKEINTIFYNKLKTTSTNEEIDIAYKLANIIDIELEEELQIKKFYLLTNETDLITEEEQRLYEERKISNEDIENLKLERVDISSFTNLDKKAASIYHLMNLSYEYDKKMIKTNITNEELATIIESNITGISAEVIYERIYPYEDTLRSVLGTIGPIHLENKDYYIENGYNLSDTVGISYLEYEYEEYLKGEKAIYKVNSDGSLKLIKEEQKGSDIYLSIDINIQLELDKIIKRELENAKKYPNTDYFSDTFAGVSDPNSGQIIALSGYRIENNTFKEITNDILNSSFTVGSVVKGATISVGYNNELINESTYVYDSCIKLEFIPEKCSWKPLGYINDIEALRMSSNYFQYLIAISLTGNTYRYNMPLVVNESHFNTYRSTLNEYGLGVLTEIDLPNEGYGNIGQTIAPDLLLNLTIGQYDTYTTLQLLQYINTIGGNKERIALSLVNKIENDNELIFQNKPNILNDLTISEENYNRIKQGFIEGATSGTGYGYIPINYNPAGKTGTSESFLDSDNDGKIDTNTMTLTFAGYAPYDNPKYSIAVIAPHIGVQDEDDDYIYRITRYISNDISKILFDN